MDKKVERTQPTLSIIVPVYNVEKYLPKCIESILAQSFTDFEVILIDDGATDKSGEICEEYANKDTRIKIIHKENGGLSSARNAGIELSNGNYIGFVDSDDFIHPQMYEILLREARSSNSDVVICRYKCWNEGEEQGQIIQQDINQYEIKD
ncbi:MAG: glycosyltransferase, partial [Niameybacter sp.]